MTLKILIADDSATIQKIVTLAFGCEDAVVECASDGQSALDAICRVPPDVVLADVFMPGLGGYEICARIKEDPELGHVPVILLTGTFEPFDEVEASRVKSDGHLIKPFDTSELVETVQSLAKKKETTLNRNTSVEAPVMDMQTRNASSPERPLPGVRVGVNPQVWNSYLGSDRILDLFDLEIVKEADSIQSAIGRSTTAQTIRRVPDTKIPAQSGETLSEAALDLIVERVMQRISADVIREVAWEVVPEMSENIIRRTIEEQKKP